VCYLRVVQNDLVRAAKTLGPTRLAVGAALGAVCTYATYRAVSKAIELERAHVAPLLTHFPVRADLPAPVAALLPGYSAPGGPLPPRSATGFVKPLNLPGPLRVSSEFDTLRPNIRPAIRHGGMDLPAPEGTPVYAVEGGRVLCVSTPTRLDGFVPSSLYWHRSVGKGNGVVIASPSGVWTYMHFVQYPSVSKGDVVSAGQVIGFVGSTGWSTGNHLHLQHNQSWGGTLLNPRWSLPAEWFAPPPHALVA